MALQRQLNSAAKMTHFRRIAAEQALQVLSFGITFIDRVLLTGILYRAWGVAAFEAWSLCVAIASLIIFFEFGFNMYFGNRIMIEIENGKIDEARHTLRLGNTIFGLCMVASLVSTAVALQLPLTASIATGRLPYSVVLTAIAIQALGPAMRLSLLSICGLYRANREYGRIVVIGIVGDLTRVIAVAAVVLLGGDIIWASLVTLISFVITQCGFIIYDIKARYSLSPFQFDVPTLAEIKEILGTSSGYFAQALPILALAYVPVLFISERQAAAGIVASFVLMRTFANLPRAIMQSLGIVLGQECARRIAVNDLAGAMGVFSVGSRAFAVLSGLAAGMLIECGPEIVSAWTGDGAIHRQDYVLAAFTPMLLASTASLTQSVLASSNIPYLAAAGRMLQLALTIALAAFLPIPDMGLRMFVALAAGEVLGFAPLSYIAVASILPSANARFHLMMLLLTIFAAVIGLSVERICFGVLRPTTLISVVMSVGLGAALSALSFPWLGLPPAVRTSIVSEWVAPAFSGLRRSLLFRLGV